ncbi:MAG TPA: site-specific DNA-methyltransferase, partial [Candidatus Paceibacterota bacterium]|nr:site-specific DNA-methyltransferase [Candidatus Paceibacterota bacterium]
ENRPKVEPRILLEDPAKSYHAKHRVTDDDIFDNKLIFGDNLLALKALEQDFSGKIKCIYIDPPYNTGSAFKHYDDGIEHSLWLSLIRERLEILRRLLSEDGVLFAQIDDNEGHYLKVMMDEIFGRANFITTFIWQKVDSPNDNKVAITPDHEFILCYAKNVECAPFKQMQDSSVLDAFSNCDASGRLYRDRLLKKNGKSSMREDRPSMYFPVKAPDGTIVFPVHDDGRDARWAMGKAGVDELIARNELVWKNRGSEAQPKWIPYTREYAPEFPARPYSTIWLDVQTSRQAKSHQKEFLPSGTEPFATPKPEPLIQRIVEMTTNRGDWVLDSFGGSGTTGAVAHKMGRRWIMVELGDHCHTHIIPRMKKVIDGADTGGITPSIDWKGGGGFRYYHLAPSLLKTDKWGNLVINKEFNADMLSQAVCKLEGYNYAPSDTLYWQHGHASEKSFIYVTTQHLTREQLTQLNDEVGSNRSLLVCCASFRGKAENYPHLEIKKIPKAVLAKCEWGHDDYSLKIENLPKAPPPKGQQQLFEP